MARGGAWMVAMRWAMKSVGLVSTLVLVRLLDPADFGVIAMAMIVVGFLEVLTMAGVDLAVIRHENPERADYDAAWTLQVMLAAGIGALLLVCAPYAAAMFDEPKLVAVLRALALRAVIGGFQNIGVAQFRRDLAFHKDFQFNVYKTLLTSGVTVIAALILRSYWALVVGMIASQVFMVALSYTMHPYRPRLTLSRLGQYWSFSVWLIVHHLARFLNRRLDQFIIGNVAGTQFMGRYSVAFDVATLPTNELVVPMNRGFFPVYARLQGDPQALAAGFVRALSTVALLCFALGFGLFAVAEPAVLVLMGSRWADAVPLVEALAVFGVFLALATSVEALLMSVGRTRLLALFGIANVALLAVALAGTVRYLDIDAVAWARCWTALAALPLVYAVVRLAVPVSVPAVVGALWPRFVAAALMVGAVKGVPWPDLAPIALLALQVATGAAVYGLATWGLWRLRGAPDTVEKSVLDRVSGRLTRFRAAG
nr:lipopolysaccharide biosynthesis protein [Rhodothalassium salexigens]